MIKEFRKVLQAWIDECSFAEHGRMMDGTPKMGKFEAEDLYRQGKKFLAETESGVKEVPVPHRFTWIDRPAKISGEDFSYLARVLCSFPKSNGKVRYIVEDNGRLFIQREEQIQYR
jgi:hypothetical protein